MELTDKPPAPVALGRDGRPRPHVPDVLAKHLAGGLLAISHYPAAFGRSVVAKAAALGSRGRGTPGRASSRGSAWGSSCACPGAKRKAIARSAPSAITQALLLQLPRERLSASPEWRCAAAFLGERRRPPSDGRARWRRRGGHAELHAACLDQGQQALPHALA
jgi:hypothetical protein